MIYKPGPLTSEQRGSIGGISFSRNTSGNFARRRNVPSDVRTASQMSVRAVTSYLSSSWRQLQRNQMLGWNALARQFPRSNRLGETYYLSGQQMYMFLNRNLQSASKSIISDAPDIVSNIVPPFDLWSVSIDCTPGSLDMKLNFSPAIPVDCTVILSATSTVSSGIFYPSNFRIIAVLGSDFTSGDSIMNGYVSIFGSIPRVGECAFFRLHIVSNDFGFRCETTQYRAIGTV